MAVKFQGRGQPWFAELLPQVGTAPVEHSIFSSFGCADVMDISLTEDTWSHISKCTSANAEDARGTRSRTGTVTMSFTDWIADSLRRFVIGQTVPAGTAGTVTAEALPSGIKAGQGWLLGGATPNQTITTLVITDSTTGTPLTLVSGVDYIFDAVSGFIQFLNITGFVQPFSAAYGYTRIAAVSLFTDTTKTYFVHFEGTNAQDNDAKVSGDLYKVRLNPLARLSLLPDDFATFEVTGALLADTTKPTSGSLGQYGIIRGAP